MKKQIKNLFSAVLILSVINGCQPEPKETPTKGYLKCLVDESLFNVVNAEKDEYLKLYTDSKIDLVTMKAREGIASVLNGDARMFISSRDLNDEEREFVQKSKSEAKVYKFCFDGLVLIVNENSKLDSINVDEINSLLLGLNKKYKVIIPEMNSGIYEYAKNELLNGKEIVNAVVVNSEKEVIEKVAKSQNSIGFIGLNSAQNVNDVKILKIGEKKNVLEQASYWEPLPGYLIKGWYPLTRTSYIILNEVGFRVASGFTSFLTSYDGQKIVKENNLGPATVPVKLVQ